MKIRGKIIRCKLVIDYDFTFFTCKFSSTCTFPAWNRTAVDWVLKLNLQKPAADTLPSLFTLQFPDVALKINITGRYKNIFFLKNVWGVLLKIRSTLCKLTLCILCCKRLECSANWQSRGVVMSEQQKCGRAEVGRSLSVCGQTPLIGTNRPVSGSSALLACH